MPSKNKAQISSIETKIVQLEKLIHQIQSVNSLAERLKILDQTQDVKDFFQKHQQFKKVLNQYDEQEQWILKSLLAIGQGDIIFHQWEQHEELETPLKILLDQLIPVEKFYETMGGILGYHIVMLQLILDKHGEDQQQPPSEKYLKPSGYDISQETPLIHQAIRKSLENLSHLVEIYPVGGAGDRLKLQDDKTGEDLPSAELLFEGRTLLEGLIRDLQAKEFLYYRLSGKQEIVPVAMMTSDEKNNEMHMIAICERAKWFGRPKKSFEFFKQPMVPVLTEEGMWAVSESMKLIFKPGGHGVIWKLALDIGIIDRLVAEGRTKALIRQINNPIAATDTGLLAFVGCGLISNQEFGFSSCPRLLNTAEGMNVLIERQLENGVEYCISNIEYPDFVKKHIQDVSESPGSPYSAFPANTNILFVDLEAIKKAVEKAPVPGMLINMKHKVSCLSSDGEIQEIFAGRLESLMQNIADVMTVRYPQQQKDLKPEDLLTYLTYNERRKTISVTKKSYTEGQSIVETPEGCYYDLLMNHHELFSTHCRMQLPVFNQEEEYIKMGPNFILSFHPALGPLYSLIGEKIQGGRLYAYAEMVLEIAELQMHQVEVDGSLLIFAENIMGHKNSDGVIIYSENVGRCKLRNVKVINRGIDREKTCSYWKRQIERKEALTIVLEGCSEFIAEDVTFEGNQHIVVPDGYRMIARQDQEGAIHWTKEKIASRQLSTRYFFNEDNKIFLRSS